ncbi:hypothetical protein C8R44DRAFT_729330 [Mycena epipterygia]|nr:hypothetical protein C8R44DRAFT_729330 [Mycena epipterygia]
MYHLEFNSISISRDGNIFESRTCIRVFIDENFASSTQLCNRLNLSYTHGIPYSRVNSSPSARGNPPLQDPAGSAPDSRGSACRTSHVSAARRVRTTSVLADSDMLVLASSQKPGHASGLGLWLQISEAKPGQSSQSFSFLLQSWENEPSVISVEAMAQASARQARLDLLAWV